MPVTELSFPAITVCRQGLDMAAVQRAMELDYEDWVARQGAARRKRSLGSGDSMHGHFTSRKGKWYCC